MSRGFIKEPEPDAPPDPPPEIPIPPPPNPVTVRGLGQIEAKIGDLEGHLAKKPAPEAAEAAELRRKLRYWIARRITAQITRPPDTADEVGFGSAVTIAWPGRGDVRIEIVGDDESEPAAGRISWRVPTAAALIGNAEGDKVEARIGGRTVLLAILAVDNSGRP